MITQEQFNTAFIGLRNQGFEQSVLEGEKWAPNAVCAYGRDDGLKCAIGHLLTDEQLKAVKDRAFNVLGMPGSLVDSLGGDMHALQGFQMLHDAARSPADMEARFRNYATSLGLTVPE